MRGDFLQIPIDFNETTNNTGVAVGTEREYDGDIYCFVHLQASSGAVTEGCLLFELPDSGAGEVTDDIANSKANYKKYICTHDIATTTGGYFWAIVKKRGVSLKTNGDGDIAAGVALKANATGNSVDSYATAGTAVAADFIGVATADDDTAGTTVVGDVDLT